MSKGIAREPKRLAITGIPRATWWRLRKENLEENTDPFFPKPVRLGGKRSIGWKIEDLERWIESREQLEK